MGYKSKLKRYAKQNDKRFSLILRQDFQANFDELEHKMLIERETLDRVYQDMSCFEQADLEDFTHKEKNDRTNKKRRNLLC